GREYELAAMLEEKRHRAVGAEVAPVLGECMPDVGHGARTVVGHAIDDDRGTGDAVTLVADFLVVHALQIAGAALDRALNVVLGHVVVVRLVHRQTQAWIGRGVAAAHARCDRNFLDQARENLAALGVLLAFAVLYVCPLAVTG